MRKPSPPMLNTFRLWRLPPDKPPWLKNNALLSEAGLSPTSVAIPHALSAPIASFNASSCHTPQQSWSLSLTNLSLSTLSLFHPSISALVTPLMPPITPLARLAHHGTYAVPRTYMPALLPWAFYRQLGNAGIPDRIFTENGHASPTSHHTKHNTLLSTLLLPLLLLLLFMTPPKRSKTAAAEARRAKKAELCHPSTPEASSKPPPTDASTTTSPTDSSWTTVSSSHRGRLSTAQEYAPTPTFAFDLPSPSSAINQRIVEKGSRPTLWAGRRDAIAEASDALKQRPPVYRVLRLSIATDKMPPHSRPSLSMQNIYAFLTTLARDAQATYHDLLSVVAEPSESPPMLQFQQLTAEPTRPYKEDSKQETASTPFRVMATPNTDEVSSADFFALCDILVSAGSGPKLPDSYDAVLTPDNCTDTVPYHLRSPLHGLCYASSTRYAPVNQL